jgi:hypothetical protein
VRIGGDVHPFEQRESAVLKLHHHAPDCRQRLLEVEELKPDRLVGAK